MNIRYGISEDAGARPGMEDEYAVYSFDEIPLFSAEIYDGHGGRKPAQMASEMLTPAFVHAWNRERKKPESDRRRQADLLRDAYLDVDAYIVKKRLEAGTCAVQLYITGESFMAANVGDSRVVMGTAGGYAVLTEDHKPDVLAECSRIEALGGTVVVFGVPRVGGILAVSRALGDACLKPYVSPEPRISEGTLGKENDHAVLACDGVWDVLSPDEVVKAARGTEDPRMAADAILRMAVNAGSGDNITVIVLDLRDYTAGLKKKKMKITGVYDRARL